MAEPFDVVIVGGGQAALAASYFLRRTGLTYVILDNGTQAGGAWVGGGNSGAQIMAELSLVAQATWVTQHDPVFLPDDVDGRVLFERATARVLGGPSAMPTGGFGDIVMVPPVRAARERGVLHAVRQFVRMTATGVVWPDGREEAIDAIIWCTGFRPALSMFAPLDVIEPDGLIRVNGQQAVREPRLWLLGYGSWCGPASATLLGAGRVARSMVRQLAAWLASPAQGVRLPKP